MPIRIENKSTRKLPKKTEITVQSVFDLIPVEHLRGLNLVVFVDRIAAHPRLQAQNLTNLPGVYHPRQGGEAPWCEIALDALLPSDGWMKKLAARLNFKASLAYLLFSLQAQHYHLSLAYGIKKHQYEGRMKAYADKYHEQWREKQAGFRARLLKPLKPYLDRWVIKLRKSYEKQQKAAKS